MNVYAALDRLICHSIISGLVGTHSSEKNAIPKFRVSTPLTKVNGCSGDLDCVAEGYTLYKQFSEEKDAKFLW